MKPFLLLFVVLAATCWGAAGEAAPGPARPNILWITCEDTGPQLGCYGDAYATTPNLDRLAAKGMRYTHAWSTAPVCAPARTTIISGLYPSTTGSEHMRSLVPLPAGLRMYPQLLRDAGYYCTNNEKEDYNLEKPGKVWDESSRRAHWTNRPPGQPFFAIFNHTVTHESQVRKRPHTPVHAPARVRVPAYHPDTPEVRQDWAQYYDKVTEMDTLAGENLRALETAGLAEDTIVCFYGDHGPGMPRSKRFLYNSGLQVPLIVFVPEKWRALAPPEYQAGGRSDRLVSFVDLAPTLLSLAGVKAPEWMAGAAFMGAHERPPRRFNYGLRGRMDERYDFVRSVTDGRYVYLRNYLPQLPHGQPVTYMFETPTTRVWKQLFDGGNLPPAQASFWQPRPPEELYDLQSDPDEVSNLASSPTHQEVRARLRTALQQHVLATRDLGFLPEAERERRRGDQAPYAFGQDLSRYPLDRILAVAEAASTTADPGASARLPGWLGDPEPGIRYWAAVGHRIRGDGAVQPVAPALRTLLTDESPSVRVAAAEALAQFGAPADREVALRELVRLAKLDARAPYVAMEALNALDNLGPKAAPVLDAVRALPTTVPGIPERTKDGVPRLIAHLLGTE
jgi:arylsulfatase A-like enzyme